MASPQAQPGSRAGLKKRFCSFFYQHWCALFEAAHLERWASLPEGGSQRIMDAKRTLITAAELFVQPAFRERFVHEAMRKPGKLMTRIAHDIESVFESQFHSHRCTRHMPQDLFDID
jgi:hypothetical protein